MEQHIGDAQRQQQESVLETDTDRSEQPAPPIDASASTLAASSTPLSAASASASAAATAPTPAATPAAPVNNANALRLAWSFGFNKDLVNGVHNLTTDDRRAVFYTAAHTGVIYDYAQRQQKLLQGHCHPITSCVVSEDKRWIVTADRGPESMIVVWDAVTGNPIKTIFQPHRHGVQAIDISPDALFLVTLSAVEPSTGDSGVETTREVEDDDEDEGNELAASPTARWVTQKDLETHQDQDQV
ncbi:hypothetical protein PINS_up002792 [Pythium insidiosum]|nr:hypothetical protein PINS_up002792 [Pythium insidiosum]